MNYAAPLDHTGIKEATSMSTNENETLVRRYWEEAWNKCDLPVVDEFYQPTFLLNGESFAAERFKRRIKGTLATFPDFQATIDDLFSAGDDKVVDRVTYTATMLGPMGDKPATGKETIIKGIDIFVFRDGKVVEHWHETNHWGMMRQLGLIPDAS